MNVSSIKKSKGLYEIVFDNNETVLYHEEVIIKYNLLRSNIEISSDVFNSTLLDNRYFLCRDKAIKYAVNYKFKSQVKKHLLKYEELFIVQRVLLELVERKIIDDYNIALIYTQSRYKKGYGNKDLQRKLSDYYVEKNIITNVLEENRENELYYLDVYVNKLLKTIKPLNKKDLKQKLEQRLVVHGYNFSDIKNSLSNIELDEVEIKDVFDKYFDKAIRKYGDEDKYKRDNKIINFLLSKGFEIDLIKRKINIWREECDQE